MVLGVGKKSEIRLKSEKFDPCIFKGSFRFQYFSRLSPYSRYFYKNSNIFRVQKKKNKKKTTDLCLDLLLWRYDCSYFEDEPAIQSCYSQQNIGQGLGAHGAADAPP